MAAFACSVNVFKEVSGEPPFGKGYNSGFRNPAHLFSWSTGTGWNRDLIDRYKNSTSAVSIGTMNVIKKLSHFLMITKNNYHR
jgi:hypothetical protein